MKNLICKKLISLVFVVFIFSLSACKSDSVGTNDNPIPIDSSAFKYPFTNGSSWNYIHNITVSNIRPDSIRHHFSQYPVNGSGIVSIQYDTTVNLVTTKCFLESYTENGSTRNNRVYFINNDTALIEYAYWLNSGVEFMPIRKNHNGIYFTSGRKTFRSLEEQSNFLNYGLESAGQTDTVILNTPPRISLKYPIKTGTEWIVAIIFSSDTLSKKYTGYVNLAVGNNFISCAKVQWHFSYLDEATSIDYVSKYGVVKKEFSMINEKVGDEFGNILGYIDWNETYQLTSYNIVNP